MGDRPTLAVRAAGEPALAGESEPGGGDAEGGKGKIRKEKERRPIWGSEGVGGWIRTHGPRRSIPGDSPLDYRNWDESTFREKTYVAPYVEEGGKGGRIVCDTRSVGMQGNDESGKMEDTVDPSS